MNFYKTVLISALFCCLAACGKKPDGQARTAKPASGAAAAGQAPAAEPDAVGQVPGAIPDPPESRNTVTNYFDNLANDPARAKAAREAQEKAQKERQKLLEQAAGGN